MYHYVYRLDHIETDEFYIGSRSCKCHPTLDNYLGSMSTWKPDKTKLKKEIIKDDFLIREDALMHEARLISQYINHKLNRNYNIPNKGFSTAGTLMVKDLDGNIIRVSVSDKRYISGELMSVTTGFITAKDADDNTLYISIKDPRYISGLYFPLWKNRKHTIDTKKKISDFNKGKGMGKDNSQYGTCWIYNDKIKKNKKIDKNELLKFINEGWLSGRKMKF